MKGEPRSRLGRARTLAGRWMRWLATAADGAGAGTAARDFRDWTATTLLGRELWSLDLPWVTFPAARWLEARCRPGLRVFEWGSGASTAFFARRGCRVVSVEHDPAWHARMAVALAEEPEVELRLVPEERAERVGPADGPGAAEGLDAPDGFDAADGLDADDGSAAAGFGPYVAAIDDQPGRGLDLVVVDGRARVDCLRRAGPKVAVGGTVLLDDSEREIYRAGVELFAGPEWETVHLPGPKPACVWPAFTRTSLFIRRG